LLGIMMVAAAGIYVEGVGDVKVHPAKGEGWVGRCTSARAPVPMRTGIIVRKNR
jgi:hypothetical protein